MFLGQLTPRHRRVVLCYTLLLPSQRPCCLLPICAVLRKSSVEAVLHVSFVGRIADGGGTAGSKTMSLSCCHITLQRAALGCFSPSVRSDRGQYWGKPTLSCFMRSLKRASGGFCPKEVLGLSVHGRSFNERESAETWTLSFTTNSCLLSS